MFNYGDNIVVGDPRILSMPKAVPAYYSAYSPLTTNGPAQIASGSATRNTNLPPSGTTPSEATTLVGTPIATPRGAPFEAAYQSTEHIPDATTHVVQTTYDPSPSDVGMSLGGQVLNSGRPIGLLAPVPHIREAAEIALVILDGVKKTKKNRACFEKIGKQCLTLVEIINLKVDTQAAGGQSEADLKALIDAFIVIKGYVTKFNSRSWPRRSFLAWVDTGVVQDCRNQLNFAITRFNIQSFIDSRRDVQYIRDILDVPQSNASKRRARRKRYQAREKRRQEIQAAREMAPVLKAAGAREVEAARAFAEALVKPGDDGRNS